MEKSRFRWNPNFLVYVFFSHVDLIDHVLTVQKKAVIEPPKDDEDLSSEAIGSVSFDVSR